MAGGNRKYHDCHEIKSYLEAETNIMAEAVLLILSGIQNFVNLLFVIQFQTIKFAVSKICSRIQK